MPDSRPVFRHQTHRDLSFHRFASTVISLPLPRSVSRLWLPSATFLYLPGTVALDPSVTNEGKIPVVRRWLTYNYRRNSPNSIAFPANSVHQILSSLARVHLSRPRKPFQQAQPLALTSNGPRLPLASPVLHTATLVRGCCAFQFAPWNNLKYAFRINLTP
jgi:hypothetical protein